MKPDGLIDDLRALHDKILKADDHLIYQLIDAIRKEWPKDPIGEEFIRQIEETRKRRPSNN